MTKKRLYIIILGAVALIVFGYGLYRFTRPPKADTATDSNPVPMKSFYVLWGKVIPNGPINMGEISVVVGDVGKQVNSDGSFVITFSSDTSFLPVEVDKNNSTTLEGRDDQSPLFVDFGASQTLHQDIYLK